VDEKIDEYQHSKTFVEMVIHENKLLSEEIKSMLKQYIKQVMANIFRLKNPVNSGGASSEQTTPSSTQTNFFITQDGKAPGAGGKPPMKTLPPLPFTMTDFLDVLKNLEENNIFMF
jgi:hypothetical protein